MEALNKVKSNIRRKLKPSRLLKSFQLVFSEKFLLIRFMHDSYRPNWGDALNIYLVKKTSKKIPLFAYNYFNFAKKNVYSVVGSVLDDADEKNLIVWGSGFLKEKSQLKSKPKKVLAVRGKLTRQKLIDVGVACPEVYGDDALLLPLY